MQKVIFLVDMNAFFISCEMSRNPVLRGKPAAVAGDPTNRTGIILAASYEARSFGVRTTMLLHDALRLCPGLILVPPDHALYEQKSREVMAMLSHYTPVLEQNSIDEAWLDMTGCEGLFGQPAESARQIMREVETRLGLWCSIGISENKFLAKMASEMKKPHGITELWPQDVPVRLWPLPTAAMYGIGPKTAEKLTNLGIKTIGDLAGMDESFLVRLLGKGGIDLLLHARGIDPDPVLSNVGDSMKSIGRSTTLSEDIVDLDKARLVLLTLADEIGRSARKHSKKGHTVQITLKYSDFKVITRQAAIPATYATQDIYNAGCRLLEQYWKASQPVRLIGIGLSGFMEADSKRQVSIFDQPGSVPKNERNVLVDQAMDKIRDRLGENSITRAPLIKRDKKKQTE
jgi:DNA polymerase-4